MQSLKFIRKIRLYKYFLILAFTFTFLNCNKVKDPPLGPYLLPHTLFFLIQQNGQRLPDSILNHLKMEYVFNKENKYVPDFQRATGGGRDLGIMITRRVGYLSSGHKKIKTYYLVYPDGDIDTLYVDYDYVPSEHADTTACYCLYPLREVKFNGKKAYRDSSIKVQRVLLFKKD